MVQGRSGLDVAALVGEVLSESRASAGTNASRFAMGLSSMIATEADRATEDPYARLFSTTAGNHALNVIQNESGALDVLSALSVELLYEYLDSRWGLVSGPNGLGRRCLSVPGAPEQTPVLLVLDPAIADVSGSRRLTDELELDPSLLVFALERMRLTREVPPFFLDFGLSEISEFFWITQPEVILTRRPRMVPLCAPSPYLTVACGRAQSSVGVFCRDSTGEPGVTACFHGTGPAGTAVTVDGQPSFVKEANAVQDIVFIPLDGDYAVPNCVGTNGVRQGPAPSQAEPVEFDGAGSQSRVTTRVQSHDAGILRRRSRVQLKVQTPAVTNTGDSGSALVDGDDRVVGFGFERTAIGEFPELTDWIRADNALDAIGLTPI